ncbi:hypothetical protein [Pelagibaculum spongiae]|uniref:hypothetical protein n=1 Tax=Pelagibaculum spongiae TaxID=2080658 RepID=UPI00131431DD|nr:hypothetical protein [Pelagibaculum spongiae]
MLRCVQRNRFDRHGLTDCMSKELQNIDTFSCCVDCIDMNLRYVDKIEKYRHV